MPAAAPKPLLVDLALQGGGSHGAFTWGVLDRLLEEDWLTFDGISGTSAGAMNAAVMASGHAHGGIDGAKAALETFWQSVSESATLQPGAAQPDGLAVGPLDAGRLADVPGQRDADAHLLALRPEPHRRASAAPASWPRRSISTALAGVADQAVHHRHQRAHRPRARVPQRRDHARRAAGLGLPADHVPGGGDRRRALLGRRLRRQPDDHAAGARMPLQRHDPGADQPDRARRGAARPRATS